MAHAKRLPTGAVAEGVVRWGPGAAARGCILAALVVAFCLASRVSEAQGAQPTDGGAQSTDGARAEVPLRDALSGAAREAYDAATVLLNNRDCGRAIAKYQEAYDLAKDPRLLFDMAVCERDLHAYARMQNLLLRYEKEAGSAISEEQKAEVQAALGAIRNLVVTLQLIATEDGAQVRLDNESVGTTPLAAPLVVDLGKHVVSVTKDGFEPVEKAIDLAGGNETSMTLVLVRQQHPGVLRVTAGPDATVTIDGTTIAHGVFDGPLPPGPHELAVTEPGKKRYVQRLILGDRETRILDVTLEPDHRPMPLWPWLTGGALAVAGGCVGVYFLVRSRDNHSETLPPLLFSQKRPPGAQ